MDTAEEVRPDGPCELARGGSQRSLGTAVSAKSCPNVMAFCNGTGGLRGARCVPINPKRRPVPSNGQNDYIAVNDSIVGELDMATLTIRNVSDDVHRALRVRAASNGRSTEAEVRTILESTVRQNERRGIGTALAAIGRTIGLTEAEAEAINQVRDKTPAEPMKL